MKRLIAIIITLCLVSLIAFAILPASVSASGGDAAKLDKVVVTCNPPQQGLGGEVEITAEVHVYGGCCYHLYTYGVTAELIYPAQIQMIGEDSDPASIGEIDGLPGGVPTTREFKWKVKSDVDGNFDLKVVIETDNSGSVEGSCVLKYTKGAKISSPTLFPSMPEEGKGLQINFNAEPTLPGITLEDLRLYYVIMDEEFGNKEIEEANGTDLVINRSGVFERITGTEASIEGDSFDETLFKARIEKLEKEGHLYYWIAADDSKGETSTSSHYHAEVKNVEEVYLIKNIAALSFLVLGIVGTILIFMFNNVRIRKAVRDRTRLYRLGSQGNTEYMDDEERSKIERSSWFYVMIVGMVILAFIAVILIGMAIATNSYAELVTHLREGK